MCVCVRIYVCVIVHLSAAVVLAPDAFDLMFSNKKMRASARKLIPRYFAKRRPSRDTVVRPCPRIICHYVGAPRCGRGGIYRCRCCWNLFCYRHTTVILDTDVCIRCKDTADQRDFEAMMTPASLSPARPVSSESRSPRPHRNSRSPSPAR